MKKITVIIHGRYKHRERLMEDIRRTLSGRLALEFCETGGPGDAARLAEAAVAGGTDYLVAAGGDGTLHEMVNGCMNCDPALCGRVVLGIFPCGNGNDFARTIGVRQDVGQLAGLIARRRAGPVDVGEIRFRAESGEPRRRYFINIADAGLGGVVVRKLGRARYLLGARLAYGTAILESFFRYRHQTIRLTADGLHWEGPALSVCLANGRYFGRGLCIAPRADVSDGRIEIVILGRVTLWDYLRHLPAIKRGEMIRHPEVRYESAAACRLDAPAGRLALEMDGEFVGYAPLEMSVHPGALRFLRAD